MDKKRFVIFGSGPMVIRGLKEFNDLDVLVTEELFKKWLPWSKGK